MKKEDAENRLGKSVKQIGKRVGHDRNSYIRACEAKDIFIKHWDDPEIDYFRDHLIKTSEYAAYETLSPAVFTVALFHHLKPSYLTSSFVEEKKTLESFSKLNDEFAYLDILISNYIDTDNPIQLAKFKKRVKKAVKIVNSEKGLEALFVLLASQLHELEVGEFPSNWQNSREEIAERALFFYVPFTHFLGLNQWTALMESYALRHLASGDITGQRNYLDVEESKQYIPHLVQKFENLFTKKHPVDLIDFSWRTKGIFSIWEKLQKTGAEPRDMIGFRIVVENKKQCYDVRNRILSQFRIRSNKHDDYFTSRDTSQYQAIHLGLSKKDLPRGCPSVEIQIRDWDNHFRAEDGDLRHSTYKLKNRKNLGNNDKDLAEAWGFWLNTWVQGLLSAQTIIRMSDGKIVSLPKKPKILDLLYKIDKLKPNLRISAKRNKFNLDQTKHLVTGDIITLSGETEIKTLYFCSAFDYASHRESRRWLRDNIPADNNSSPVIDYADDLITEILRKNNISDELAKVILTDPDYKNICLQAAEYGPEYVKENVFNKFYDEEKSKRKSFFIRLKDEIKTIMVQTITASQIRDAKILQKHDGVKDEYTNHTVSDYSNDDNRGALQLIRYYRQLQNFRATDFVPKPIREAPDQCAIAMCCNPIPRDKITGHISKNGEYVVVHRKDCFLLKAMMVNNRERRWNYEWNKHAERTYDVGLELLAFNKDRIQKEINEILSKNNIKINKTISIHFPDSLTMLYFYGLKAQTVRQVNKVIRTIERIKQVITIQRSVYPDLIAHFLFEYDSVAKKIWKSDF